MFTSPVNAIHNQGDNVTFTCKTDAGPGSVYVWLRNGSELVCLDCEGDSFNGTINVDRKYIYIYYFNIYT